MLLFDNDFIRYVRDITQYARHEVLISTFKAEISSSPRGRLLNSLIDDIGFIARKGIDVKILLNWNTAKARVPRTNLKFQREMIKQGVKIRHLKANRCVHAKLFIVDGGVMVLGSHNLSVNSNISNFEISTITTNDKIIAQARNHFLRLFNDGVEF